MVNKNGLTYGSDFYSTCVSDSPDLILAEGKNVIEKNMNIYIIILDYVYVVEK